MVRKWTPSTVNSKQSLMESIICINWLSMASCNNRDLLNIHGIMSMENYLDPSNIADNQRTRHLPLWVSSVFPPWVSYDVPRINYALWTKPCLEEAVVENLQHRNIARCRIEEADVMWIDLMNITMKNENIITGNLLYILKCCYITMKSQYIIKLFILIRLNHTVG